MPKLDHTGPSHEGPKTGRKLGKCHKTESDQLQIGDFGVGKSERHHSGGGPGKGKRLKYNQNK